MKEIEMDQREDVYEAGGLPRLRAAVEPTSTEGKLHARQEFERQAVAYVRTMIGLTSRSPEWDAQMHTDGSCPALVGSYGQGSCPWCNVVMAHGAALEEADHA